MPVRAIKTQQRITPVPPPPEAGCYWAKLATMPFGGTIEELSGWVLIEYCPRVFRDPAGKTRTFSMFVTPGSDDILDWTSDHMIVVALSQRILPPSDGEPK